MNNLDKIKQELPADVKLIVVSKTQPVERIREVYDAGQRRFGENRVNDLATKYGVLPKDIEWHFIGHLQTNKVKVIAPFISMIQSIDSLKLLCEVDREARRNNRIIGCLLEIYIASEETKYGLDITEARDLLSSPEFRELKNIQILGVMGMATYTTDVPLIHKEFGKLKGYFDTIKHDFFPDNPMFSEISMGMSGDYRIAIEQGSTMVRIGSAIFKR